MSVSSAAAATVEAIESNQLHILVVEDELLIRMMISDALREEGFAVIEAVSADEAADILAAGKAIDLVLSDVRMPGSLDGLGLVRFIKQHFPELPVILTSAHLDPSSALAEGAKHFLRKPYRISTVLTVVTTELAKPA
jgi:CheY-like chemotaxis protein